MARLRRTRKTRLARLLLAILGSAIPLSAQLPTPINPRQLPPPPPAEKPPAESTPQPAPPPVAAREPLPATVVVPGGTRIEVVLDTPLSTRISKKGQVATFRTSQPLPLEDSLSLPADTAFTGSVTSARRPGAFGKSGELRVKVERVELPGGGSFPIVARLDSADLRGQGRASADNNRAADLLSLATWTAEGTLIGAQVKGGKGAAVGAGAGAAIAMIILMSRRGSDVYLEPGTPFTILLDQPLTLPGGTLAAAEKAAPITSTPESGTASIPAASGSAAPAIASSEPPSNQGSNDPATDPDRPKLKHRPKPPQP